MQIQKMILAAVVALVPALSAMAHEKQFPQVFYDYNYDTSGRRLLHGLYKVGSPYGPLLEPGSKAEDQLTRQLDLILDGGFEQYLYLPVADYIDEVTEDLFHEFLMAVGKNAFESGATKMQYLEYIKKMITPKPASCEVYLHAHPAPDMLQ